MSTKVVHCKKAKYDVYIGRPSIWGNPYSHKIGTLAEFSAKDRDDAVAKYKEYILSRPALLKRLPELKGKTLGCWCKPKSCHGDILADMADNYEEKNG